MTSPALIWIMVATSAAPGFDEPSVAESAKLKDGRTVLGLVERAPSDGPVVMVVRREWAKAAFADLYPGWVEAERPANERGKVQRRLWLEAWKRDRDASPLADDRVLRWINRELKRPAGVDGPETPLIRVTLPRDQVQAVTRRPEASTRLLRAGWVAEFDGPETMTPAELADSLAARGLDPAREPERSVASMLPPYPELESSWLARRAATEVIYEPALRFVDQGGMILPDPVANPDAKGTMMGIPNFAGPRLDDTGTKNPAPEATLRDVKQRGRVGAAVTVRRPIDGDSATAETSLWVLRPNGKWTKAATASATVRFADLTDEDRQKSGAVKSQFTFRSTRRVVVNGKVVEDSTVTDSNVGDQGAASWKAAGKARDLFRDELNKLALDLD